jgi:HEAT repeat protein
MKTMLYILAALLVLPALAPGAPTTEALIGQLGSTNEQARAEARQLLPYRELTAVAPAMLGLLSHEDQGISWAAMRVLEDLANQTTVRGREEERRYITELLMTLLAPEQPAALQEKALRMLPPIVPAGYPLSPVAALLQGEDAVLREKARAALREIGTSDAAATIAAALDSAGPEFQTALLHALASMQQANTLPDARRLLRNPEAEVRAAACHALAWSPRKTNLQGIAEVHEAMEGKARFQTGLALLRQADALIAAGGHWRTVIAQIESLVHGEPDPNVRAGAIVALGRHGDETAVAQILAVLGEDGGHEYEPAAMAAFEGLRGTAGAYALLEAYPELSLEMQASMLRIFGRKKDELFLDIMRDAAASENAVLADAGLEALVNAGLPGALDMVIARVDASEGDARVASMSALNRLAEDYRAQGAREAAGKAFATLYRVAEDDAQRAHAMEGIRAFPVPEAYDIVMNTLGEEEFAALPVAALAGIARAMHESGDTTRAEEIVTALMPRLGEPEALRSAMGDLMAIPTVHAQMGFITRYYLLGPCPWSVTEGFAEPPVDPALIDLAAPVIVGEKELVWQGYESADANGLVPPDAVVGMCDACSVYAFTEVTVAEGGPAQVRTGSDDGLRIWVNGVQVLANNIDRGADLDQDIADVTLTPGLNRILLQCTQNGGGWAFLMRLTGPSGAPLAFEAMAPPEPATQGE